MKFFYGFEEGISDTNLLCEDSELDMAEFFEIATLTGDASGNSSLDIFAPSGFLGLSVLIQALDMITCVESKLNEETFTQGANITHFPVTPGQAGVPNLFTATGATPHGLVTFIWGLVEQTVSANNICPGFQSGILNPNILTRLAADQAGNVSFVINVPLSVAGTAVKLQAVDITACSGSDVVSETF